MNFLARVMGRTGTHRPGPARRDDPWALLADADELIADLVQQRDEHRDLAAAAAVELEIHAQRTRMAEERADRAERTTLTLRAELANARAVSHPSWVSEHRTVETPLPAGAARVRVMPLAEALGGAR